MCLVARAGPCDAESASTQEDDYAALCWQALIQLTRARAPHRLMRFCLSCGIAIAPDRLPDGFSPITIRATRKVSRRKDPSENCWMHIMTALPSQLPPPQEQLLLHELNHRIGNEFCCAISVVSLAAARSSDKEVKAVLTEVAELLHHYAEVHHALQMPEHGIRTYVAAYLRKLFTARIPSVRPDSSASRVPARLR